jgi:hypothetical protein
MKKIIAVLLIAILPAMAFADFQIGGAAMYKGLLSDFQGTSPGIGLEDFTFGGEARLKLSIFQAGLTGLYYPGVDYASIKALADVGLAVDILFLRIGAGIGANFSIPVSGTAPDLSPVGFNVKGSVEILLGKLSIGVVGFYVLDSLDQISLGLFQTAEPWLGVTLMYKLF